LVYLLAVEGIVFTGEVLRPRETKNNEDDSKVHLIHGQREILALTLDAFAESYSGGIL
jgi:hypothetical protein